MIIERISFIQYYERLPVAVYICDRNDELVEYNSAAASLFAIPPRTGSKDWYPSLSKFDQDGRQIDINYKPVTLAIKQHPEGIRQEVRFGMPDGTNRYVMVSSIAIRDEAGFYAGAIHTLNDITEQRRSEKQQALLAAIVDSSGDAIIAKDLLGQITSWNHGAERLFGYSATEAIGQHISLIIPIERLSEEKRIIEAISKGKKVEHFETIRLTKSGQTIPISLTISPVRNADGRIVGASKIGRDITEQKLAEEKIKTYTAHLEDMVAKRTTELDQALRKERELGQLKSRFVSMASHEFRTPLSSIKLSAALIEKYAQPYQDTHINKHIEKIKNSVNDLTDILGEFLSLEKLESGKVSVAMTEFNLAEFCLEIAAEMQLLAKPGQQLVCSQSGISDLVLLDQQLLKHCLHNLLSNAIKYSGEDTIIRLDTEVSANECAMSVVDQGIGIPEVDQPHLFSPFFRAGNTSTIQGTGLGLNIVRRYAGLMGGNIDFKSVAGKGTTFTLRFPQIPNRRTET
jgi:two-component system sensor kinase FixL